MAGGSHLSEKPQKPKKHFVRRGVPVPYIDLVEDIPVSSSNRLSITYIIVGPGPQPEKDKRRRAVGILLQQHGIDPKVVSASEIPYVG